MNINIIRCFNNVFNIEGLKNNIGSYIILSNIFISIITCSLFYIIEYKNVFKQINSIIKKKQENNKTINCKRRSINYNSMNNNNNNNKNCNNNNNICSAPKKKNKIYDLDKNTLNVNLYRNEVANVLKNNVTPNNMNMTPNSEKYKISILNRILDSDINNYSDNYKEYTDNEINCLKYKEALNIDKRTYIQYYVSLLRTKHLLIFSFYTNNDYNPRIIKINLFLFSFALLYTVNSLFFQDSTMHKIYEDYGKYNFIFQLPQILYSTIISFIIIFIVKNLSLIEKKMSEIKNSKDNNINSLQKTIKIKFIVFFILIFLFLVIFWYYLSCFGAIYKNTQIHLLKDTIISFILSLIYPFGINLLPGLFRIPSLKLRNNKGKCLYYISKIIQMI